MPMNGLGAYSPLGAYPASNAIAPASNLGIAGTGGSLGQPTTLNGALGLTPPQDGGQQMMQMMMQMMQMMMQLVMSMLGQSGPQGSQAQLSQAPSGQANLAGVGGGGIPNLSTSPVAQFNTTPIANPGANAENDPELQQSLAAIAQDPEGRTLLAEAQRQGVSISVGDTGGNNILGLFQQNGNQKQIIVGDGANVKTIVHELVHASTSEDGDSQHEEGLANVIGDRIASRVLGRQAANPNQIYNNTLPLYQGLGRFNGIEESLGRLGIVA